MSDFLQIVIAGIIGGLMAWCVTTLPTLFLNGCKAKKKH